MITVLDTQAWSKELYEGNSAFIETVDETIYIVSNVRPAYNDFVILKSDPVGPVPLAPGPGSSFSVVATYTFPVPNSEFDPVLAFDPNTGLLHILGWQTDPINPLLSDLVKFTYDTYDYSPPVALPTPVVLVQGSRIRDGYDICVLSPVSADYTVGIAVSVDQPISYDPNGIDYTPSPGMNLVFFELDPDDTILQINELVNSPIRSGNTFSSVSLISPDGTQVEMYYEAHPKILTFSDQSFTINLLLRNISGQWGSATLLTTFQGRFTDDRLTVVADGTARWVSQVYYNVLTHPQGLVGNAVFGYSADASTWIFHTVPGSTAGGSFIQATLSLSPSGANVAYLLEPFDSPATEWPLRVATLDTTLRFIDVPGFYNNLNFTWLRGSKSIIDSGSVWAVVGDAVQPITPSPLPIWISFFNVPPIAVVVPVNATVYRGAVGYDIGAGFVSGDLVLSAASTINASQDPLTFTWSENGPAGVTVNPINGVTTTLNVPRSVGGATASFQVELSVFTPLHPVNPPVYSNITVPFNAAPAITPLPPLAVPRGNLKDPSQLVVIAPIVTGMADIDDLPVYTWVQVSGTPMKFIFGANQPTLTFQALGADVSGETLVFQLSANDGVNAPAVQTFDVDVAAYNFASLDTLLLSRSVRSGNIAERHDPTQTWGTLDVSAIVTNLGIVKRSSVLDGNDRYLIISPTSVVVYGGVNPNLHVLRTLLIPINPNTGNPEATILDAVHTEQDYTLVLGANQTLYRYGTAPLHPTDDPDTEIDLTTLTSMIFNKVFTTSTFGGIRILVLTGPDGVLLLQASTRTLAVQGILELDQAIHYLYGADNVQFIRTNNVESLRSGLLLIGTIAPAIGMITNLQILNNNATFTGANNLQAGNKAQLEDLTLVAPDLNGRELLVTTANPVQFTISVEHANAGTLPYTETGTATALDAGLTYETLIDLAQGQIIGTWDSSKLRNQFVTSGEILFAPESTYSGSPAAPVLNAPTTVGTVVTLSWVEERTDLMEGYTVFYSTNGGPFFRLQTINSGVVEQLSVALTPGQTYQFQVQAFGVDGVSPLSNVELISI